MSEIVMTGSPLIGNNPGMNKKELLLKTYKRPKIISDITETTKHNMRFGVPFISEFSVVVPLDSYLPAAIDLVVAANVMDKIEILKINIINGERRIVAKDIYTKVTLKSLELFFNDDLKLYPVSVHLVFMFKNVQLANISLQLDTKIIGPKKTKIIESEQKVV